MRWIRQWEWITWMREQVVVRLFQIRNWAHSLSDTHRNVYFILFILAIIAKLSVFSQRSEASYRTDGYLSTDDVFLYIGVHRLNDDENDQSLSYLPGSDHSISNSFTFFSSSFERCNHNQFNNVYILKMKCYVFAAKTHITFFHNTAQTIQTKTKIVANAAIAIRIYDSQVTKKRCENCVT